MATESVNSDSFTSLDDYLNSWFPSHLPGLAVLVKKERETCYARNFGLADLKSGERITNHTNFRMASLTKQFTAMAVLMLERQSLLRITDPVALFLPSFSENRSKITILHLLNHTSGLPDFEEGIFQGREEQIKDEEVLEIASGNTPLYFVPGTCFRYSNTGYVVLALLVQKVSGLPFGQFLQQHIFHPLGMAHSTLYSPQIEISGRALGYAHGADGSFFLADQSLWSATMGDGCVYTSLHDYQKWLQALVHHPFFHILPIMHQFSTQIKSGTDGKYSMGWFLTERISGGLEMYHTGNSSGFSHVTVGLPEQDVWVVAFSNRAQNPHLLPAILQLAFKGLNCNLESDLIWQLPHLTR